jgi:hypothetical protein
MITLAAIALRRFAARGLCFFYGHAPDVPVWTCYYALALFLDFWDGLIVYHLANLFQ